MLCMGNRSVVILNHDYCPPNNDAMLLQWAKAMRNYMTSNDPDELPEGISLQLRYNTNDRLSAKLVMQAGRGGLQRAFSVEDEPTFVRK